MTSRFQVKDRVFKGWRDRPAGRPARNRPETDTSGSPGTSPEPETPPDGYALPLSRGSDPVILDTMAWDRPEKSASYLIPGDRPLLVDAGSAFSVTNLLGALDNLNVSRIDFIALTHVHPDQAGGAAILADRFPEATFLVHPGAATSLNEPDRLVSAMKAMGGEHTLELFGRPGAVAASRVRTVVDGDMIDLGDRQVEVIAAPGHTATHLAWLDRHTEALFCGDALGVRIPGSRAVRPATPPTDFSHRRSIESVDRLRQTEARSIYRSHFGRGEDGLELECDRAIEALERWHDSFLEQSGKAEGDEDLTRRFNASLEAKLEPVAPAVRRSLEMISPAWLNLAGMRVEREREGPPPPNRFSDAA